MYKNKSSRPLFPTVVACLGLLISSSVVANTPSGVTSGASKADTQFVSENAALDQARELFRQEQYQKGIALCGKVLQFNPMSVMALVCRASGYRTIGKFDKALLDLNKALEINPNFTDALSERGILYMGTGRFDQATADFNHILQINPKNSNALLNLGILASARGNYQTAISFANRALETDDRVPEIYEFLGRMHMETGLYPEGCADFRKACDFGLCRLYEMSKNMGRCRDSKPVQAGVGIKNEETQNKLGPRR